MYGPPINAPDDPFQYSHHPNLSTPSRPYEFSHRQYTNYFDTAPFPSCESYSSYIPTIPQYPPYYSKWDRSYFSKPTLDRSYDCYWNRSLGYEVPRPYFPSFDRFSMNKSLYDRSMHDRPMYDRPMYDRPIYDRPMYDRSMYERPIYDRPIHERSMYDRPVYDRPIYERPMYEYRFEQPPAYLSSRFEEPGRGFERREYGEMGIQRERTFGKDVERKKVFDDNHFEISRDHKKMKQNSTEKNAATIRKEFESPLSSSTKRKI